MGHENQYIIEDELEKRKDLNLEKLRAKFESYIFECEEMISKAITHALLLNDEDYIFEISKIGGRSANTNEFEIEANMLYKTNDWLKRKHDFNDNERNEFLQEILQHVIILFIRYKILNLESSIRIIHECYALLRIGLNESYLVELLL